MVAAQYALVTLGLQVDHLRLVLGTSMGCMHTWMWGESHADFVDALMPLACLPVPIAGRNRVWRDLLIDAIRSDPDWRQGEYRTPPVGALRTAAGLLLIAGSAPIQMQLALPTQDAADQFVQKYMERELQDLDANDLLYQLSASRDYDPSAGLENIRAPVMWVNSADDFINPPELGVAEREIKRVPKGRFVLLPASDQTHGHGTHTWAAVWQQYLGQLLESPPP
jgi:homoserine O-acetyltransferase